MDNKHLSFLPVPGLIVMVAVLYFTVNPSLFSEPHWLLPIANTLFVSVVCFVVASMALRIYRATGRIQILLLGGGLWAFGLGAVVAGWLRAVPATGANLNVTIYNTAALVGALFHFCAALILLAGISPEVGSKRKGFWLVFTYAGIAVFVAVFTAASVKALVPPFFVQGVGPTPLRQWILGTADILFVFSFLVLMGTYLRNRERFLFWYSTALALTSISLSAFFIQHSVGSPVGWTGRFSQYLGGIYFLIAIVTAKRSAEVRRTSFDNVITASLSPSEEKFRALAENSPDVIDRFDRELKHIYVNPAGLRLHGKPASAIIGKTIEETGVPERYGTLWRQRIQSVFATGQSIRVEDYFPTRDGLEFFQSYCVPEYGADGTVANVLVLSRNLSLRKRAEEALREASEQRRLALQAGELGTWDYRMDTGEVFWDERCRDLFGVPRGEKVPYDGAIQCIHPEDRAGVDQAVRNALAGVDGGAYHETFRVVWPDGSLHWVDSHGQVHFEGEGHDRKPVRFIGVSMDITERKRTEQALIRSEKLVSVGRLAATIAHEINNPLEAATNALYLVGKDASILGQSREMAEIADRELRRAAQIARRTLGFYREPNSRMAIVLPDLLKELAALYETQMKNKDVRLRVRSDDEGSAVVGNSGEMRQLFSNLLANSIDAVGAAGTVHVHVGRASRVSGTPMLRITVADTGAGIEEQNLKRIFEPFFTTKKDVGTGLGLWISEQIVKKHGGTIRVRSRVGRGTVFSVRLPAAAAHAAGAGH